MGYIYPLFSEPIQLSIHSTSYLFCILDAICIVSRMGRPGESILKFKKQAEKMAVIQNRKSMCTVEQSFPARISQINGLLSELRSLFSEPLESTSLLTRATAHSNSLKRITYKGSEISTLKKLCNQGKEVLVFRVMDAMTMKVQIPAYCVPALLGYKGQKHHDLETVSRTKITFRKVDDHWYNATVKGCSQDCSIADRLIQLAIRHHTESLETALVSNHSPGILHSATDVKTVLFELSRK